MAKSMWQKIYNWIESIKCPSWLKPILEEIQDIILSTMLQIGKDYLSGLTDKILYAQSQDWTNEVKFKFVYKWGMENIPNIKESVLRMAIEVLVNLAKKNGFVRGL